jgi:hypothetical protein
MPGRVYLLGVGLALVALAFAVTDWALTLGPGLTTANVRRIRPGMTLAEVEAILGRCSADSSGGRPAWLTIREWRGRLGRGVIHFGPDGRVMESFTQAAVIIRPNAGGPGPWQRLRAWLGG